MLLSFDLICRFLLVLIISSLLLVDSSVTANVTSSNGSAYIVSSSKNSFRSATHAIVTSGYNVVTSSAERMHNSSILQPPSVLPSTSSSSYGNSSIFSQGKTSDGSKSDTVRTTVRTTSSIQDVKGVFPNGTRVLERLISTSLHNRISSTTRINELRSSSIVIAPIRSNFSATSSVKTSQTEYVSSDYKSGSKETSTKTQILNSSAILSLYNATKAGFTSLRTSEHAKANITATQSLYIESQVMKASIRNITMSYGTIGRNEVTSSSNSFASKEVMSSHKLNTTLVLRHITSSSYLRELSLSSKVLESEKSPAGISSINVTSVASKKLQESSTTALNPSSVRTTEKIITSASYREGLSVTDASQTSLGPSHVRNISVSVYVSSSANRRNSTHSKQYRMNTTYASPIIPTQSDVILNGTSSRTQEVKWNASSKKHQLSTDHLTASLRTSDIIRSTILTNNTIFTSLALASNKSFGTNDMVNINSTRILASSTIFMEKTINNTFTPSLLEGHDTTKSVLTVLSYAIRSTEVKTGSIGKKTTGITSSIHSSNSLPPSHNTTHDLLFSTTSVNKTIMKGTELSTKSLAQNRSGLSNFSTQQYNNKSRHVPRSSEILSTIISPSVAAVKSTSKLGNKSSSGIEVEISTRHNSTSTYFMFPTETALTKQNSYGRSSSESIKNLSIQSRTPVPTSLLSLTTNSFVPTHILSKSPEVKTVFVVPIYTPCYISYMVTISRKVGQSLAPSSLDVEKNVTSSFEQSSIASNTSKQLQSSTLWRPTPSTTSSSWHSTSEILSKSPTQSLSRLPDSVLTSIKPTHDVSMTKSLTRSETSNQLKYTQLHNVTSRDTPTSNIAVTSFAMHEVTATRNLTGNTSNNYSAFSFGSSKSTLLNKAPTQISSIDISRSVSTFSMLNKSKSIENYVYFNISKSTSTTLVTTPSVFSKGMSGYSITVSVHSGSKKGDTSVIKNVIYTTAIQSGNYGVNNGSTKTAEQLSSNRTSMVPTPTTPSFIKRSELHSSYSNHMQSRQTLHTVSSRQNPIHNATMLSVNSEDTQLPNTTVKTSTNRPATLSTKIIFSDRVTSASVAFFEMHDTSVSSLLPSFSLPTHLKRASASATVGPSIFGITGLRSSILSTTNLLRSSILSTTNLRSSILHTTNLLRSSILSTTSAKMNNSAPSVRIRKALNSLTPTQTLSNHNVSTKSDLVNASGFGNSTFMSSSNTSVFSNKQTIQSTPTSTIHRLLDTRSPHVSSSPERNRTILKASSKSASSFNSTNNYASGIQNLSSTTSTTFPTQSTHFSKADVTLVFSSNSERNETTSMSSNEPEIAPHSTDVSLILTTTVSKKSIQFTSIEDINVTSTRDFVPRTSENSLLTSESSVSRKINYTLTSALHNTISLPIDLHATPSSSVTGPAGNLRKKRHVGNVSINVVNSSSWTTKKDVVMISHSESHSRAVNTLSIWTSSVNNAIEATPALSGNISRLQDSSITPSWKSSYSGFTNDSELHSNGYNSASIPTTTSTLQFNHSTMSYMVSKQANSSIRGTIPSKVYITANNYAIFPSATKPVTASSYHSVHPLSAEQQNGSIVNSIIHSSNSAMESPAKTMSINISRTQTPLNPSQYSKLYNQSNTTRMTNVSQISTSATAVNSNRTVEPVVSFALLSNSDGFSLNASKNMYISQILTTSSSSFAEASNGNQSRDVMRSYITVVHTSKNNSIIDTSKVKGIQDSTGNFKTMLTSYTNLLASPATVLSISPNQTVNITGNVLMNSTVTQVIVNGSISQWNKNVSSSIARANVSLYSHNITSLIGENTSDSSTPVLKSHIYLIPSPSPSFPIASSKNIRATPILSSESYSSRKDISKNSASVTATDTGRSVTVNSSATERGSTKRVSGSSQSQSKENPFTPHFTLHIIPTSSLGLCLVTYSTIFTNNSFHSQVKLITSTADETTRLPVLRTSNTIHLNASSSELPHSSLRRTLSVLKSTVDVSLMVNNKSSTVSIMSRPSLVSTSNQDHSLNKSIKSTAIFSSVSFQSSTTSYSRSTTAVTSYTYIRASPSLTLQTLTTSNISNSLSLTETKSYASTTHNAVDISSNNFSTLTVHQISPTVSSVVQTSSVATTNVPTPRKDENSILVIGLNVPEDTDVNSNSFKTTMRNRLNEVYRKGLLVKRRRRKRNVAPDSSVEIQGIQRNEKEVDVRFIVISNNKTLPAEDAAKTMNVFSTEKLSEFIGFEVLSRPTPVLKSVEILAMLIKTNTSRNLSKAEEKEDFENNLARFYKVTKKLPALNTVKATITQIFHEPLGRTYIEFIISVDNVTVTRKIVKETFDVGVAELSDDLNQEVLVAPYIPGIMQPTAMDYVTQNMQFDHVHDLQAIFEKISEKLTQVYVKAQLEGSRKRRKRALGSISAMVTGTTWTQGFAADVVYYITDAGIILNATYACSILKRLTITEMSHITSPFTVNSTPRPLTPSTSGATDKDDDYPSWFIPVVIAGSVGLLLLILIIILYCRWKKGAPPKKIQPQNSPLAEEPVQRPRMTHAAEPEPKPALRHPPPAATRIATTAEQNGHDGVRRKPAPRKHPVREGSLRRKVLSRESISTRTNPAFVEEESGDESAEDESTIHRRRPDSNAASVGKRTRLEVPRKAMPPPSVDESVFTDGEDESEDFEGESVATGKDSVLTENTNQHSAGILHPVAVMSDPKPSETQTALRFRQSVHPEPSLPPLDLKQTSLVGRVVEEEGSVQKEMKTKADIERWRNKQRQREKRLGESLSKSGKKRASFTEKKAWGRAQQEIGAVLDPEAMQPIVRKPRRKPRRKYKIGAETSEDESRNVELRGFKKITSPREERVPKVEQESHSDSDISMGEARRRMIALIDDAFTSIKSASKKHHPEVTDEVDGAQRPQRSTQPTITQHQQPPLYPRPVSLTPALPEPPPSHGRASVPSARHRRRFMNSQNPLPYPSQYYPGMSGNFSPRYPPPPPPPVVTKNPLVVWDPVDKQRVLNQSAYRPYGGHPYSYTDPSGKLHFTPVQQTPDGMGGLVWSPYTSEYAMEDFYRNVSMPGTLDTKNASFMSKMQETPMSTMPEGVEAPRDTVIDMPDGAEPGSRTGESAEPLVRAIKDELFRLASGRTPVKHL